MTPKIFLALNLRMKVMSLPCGTWCVLLLYKTITLDSWDHQISKGGDESPPPERNPVLVTSTSYIIIT